MKSNEMFYGTIEYTNPGEAIITLHDVNGEWAGSGRIHVKSGSRADLYEQGYLTASVSARSKGGRLESYRVIS